MCFMVTVAVPAADVKQDNNHLDKVNAYENTQNIMSVRIKSQHPSSDHLGVFLLENGLLTTRGLIHRCYS